MSFKVDGLDEFEKQLKKAIRKSGKLYKDLQYEVGKQHLTDAAQVLKSEGHEDSGQLIDSYERKPHDGKKEWALFVDGDTIEVGTKVFYANMLNDGHKLVKIKRGISKTGRATKRKKTVGYVPGIHYNEKALNRTKEVIPKMVEDFIKKIGKEAGFDVEK
ncbi:hypothetical protein [Paenibacillus spongiae]|uniref:HK97 gp10 family phage protein n=1 Tax=Paenibacillus spongiae TaxID=2909671 RepID=A0ABY5SHX1_9BACL|nr:hypothetical protein [Paenibacillus spongiae]UVI32085.1 hypothetical protein L1F29_09810 [Paenibacillus spongiae]